MNKISNKNKMKKERRLARETRKGNNETFRIDGKKYPFLPEVLPESFRESFDLLNALAEADIRDIMRTLTDEEQQIIAEKLAEVRLNHEDKNKLSKKS